MKSLSFYTSLVLALLLTACAQAPIATSQNAPEAKPSLVYIDITSFDRDLGAALAAKLPTVDVAFAGAVSANAVPERAQQWLHAVEQGGGTVKVSPPASTVTAKNPMLLLSLVSGVWNAIKAARAVQSYEVHKPAQAYDANIVLKISEQGDKLIDKIIFTPKAVKP